MSLSADELLRYSRQALLPEFGVQGQQRLRRGSVLLVGAGGLGSPAALYLAAAGVGTLGLVDFDQVDVTNLQRQVLYGTSDVGRAKLDVASARLRDLNPHVDLRLHREALTPANALALVRAYDVVVDGTDNFAARFLVNDACVIAKRPNVYGSVFRFEGQTSVFAAPGGPCYRCLHPEPPPDGLIPNCAEAGVLGVLPGLIGTIQATEAIKLLAGIGEPIIGRLLLYDALRMRLRQIALPRDPECPVCGEAPTIQDLASQTYDASCAEAPPKRGTGAPENPTHLTDPTNLTNPTTHDMTPDQLHQWRSEGRPHLLIDVREPAEHAATRIEGCELIPLRSLPFEAKRLPKDRPIVVYCQSGGRSAIAVAMLRLQGFTAHNLSGGIRAWEKTVGT